MMQNFLLTVFEPVFLTIIYETAGGFVIVFVITLILGIVGGVIHGLYTKRRDKNKIDKNDSMSIGQIKSNQIIRNKDENMKNNVDNFSSNICPACGMDLDKKVPGHSTVAEKFDEYSEKQKGGIDLVPPAV